MEPFAGQREELVAPGREQGTDGDAQVHDDDENRDQRAEDGKRNLHAGIDNQHAGPRCLAGQRRGGLGLKIVLLDDEHQHRDREQDDRHGGGAGLVVVAGNLQVDGRRQGIIGTTDQHRVGEVGNRFDEGDQEGVAETRQHQRKRHAGEHLEAARSHVAGSLLQGRIDILEQSLEHHVADREEGHRLDDDDTPETIDAVVVDSHQVTGDDARLSEQHDHGKGKDERRGDDRQQGYHLEQPSDTFSHPYVYLDIGEQQADRRGDQPYDETDTKRVGDRLVEVGHVEDPDKIAE